MCGSKRLWFFLGALALTSVCLPNLPLLAQDTGTSQSDAIIDSVGGTVSSSNNLTEEMKEELSETATAIQADGLTEGSLTDGEIANSPYAAHNAWMLVCCALVLFMTSSPQRMDAGLLCTGSLHDRARFSPVLWWTGASQECS